MQAASWHRSVLAMLTTTVVVAAGLLIGGVSPATAAENGPAPIEQRNATTVTADPLPTVQIDSGVVWAQVIVGRHGVRGRQLLERPAGRRRAGHEPDAAQQHPRLQHHDRRVDLLRPAINGTGQVPRGLTRRQHALRRRHASPRSNGQTRFNVAAFDVATGALSTTFKPAIGGSYVNAIVATNSDRLLRRPHRCRGRGHPQEPRRGSARTARCSDGRRPPTCRSTPWC